MSEENHDNLEDQEEEDLFAVFDESEDFVEPAKTKKPTKKNNTSTKKQSTKKSAQVSVDTIHEAPIVEKNTPKKSKKSPTSKSKSKKKSSESGKNIKKSDSKSGDKKELSLQEIIPQISNLLLKLDDYMSERYYNSHPVAAANSAKPKINKIKFTLPEMLLVGALSQSSVLLSGSSGTGKTYLCELMSYFLFGETGYTRKNITPDMNEQDFLDIDFGAIKAGKKLKEAMTADQLFSRPALILDEPNRAPPLIQNRLMQILENNIDLKSKTIHAGLPLPDGGFYHWNLLTLNFGEEYAGTTPVDRALRDRITIDIPIDNFPPSISDQIKMIRETQVPFIIPDMENKTKFLLDTHQQVESIKMNKIAELLILYLSFCSSCVKSQSRSKYGIVFSPQFCKDKDCQFARNPPLNAICPFTFAPSNRVLRKVVRVAKAFAIIRLAKIYTHLLINKDKKSADKFINNEKNLEVSTQDVIKVAPFILNSKMGMIKEWVLNNFNGNSYFACKAFLNVIYKQVNNFRNNLLPIVIKDIKGNTLNEKEKGILNKALKEDFRYKGLIKYVQEM